MNGDVSEIVYPCISFETKSHTTTDLQSALSVASSFINPPRRQHTQLLSYGQLPLELPGVAARQPRLVLGQAVPRPHRWPGRRWQDHFTLQAQARRGHHDELRDAKLLVYANKQDQPGCMSTHEIREKLNLESVTRNLSHVQPMVAVSGDGVYEGIDWLSKALTGAV